MITLLLGISLGDTNKGLDKNHCIVCNENIYNF